MRKHTFSLLFLGFAMQSYAALAPLDGFYYGPAQAPVGNEWESPENLAFNKEQPRAYFFSFQDVTSARNVLPEYSKFWQSLNGEWDFHWAPNPDERPKDFYQPGFNTASWDKIAVPSNWNIEGIQKDGSLKYGVPIYVNQPVIFHHEIKVDDWRGGVMRTPKENWTTFKHRNEVGSFRREFDIPQDWDGREVFISFDGVDSFFYLWINGHYIGFSKNSRNAARFNITPYLKAGKNMVAAEVYRSSDASFLEAQDMFRLPGIFRTVAIYSTPKVQIKDLRVIPDLDENYQDGSLTIDADIRNFGKKKAKGYSIAYSLFANKLYSDENAPVENAVATGVIEVVEANQTKKAQKTVLQVKNPNKWSAEAPYRYTLVAELKDNKGKTIETVSSFVGFREVEIKETAASQDEFGLAGRYYYVNGKTVKLKGVNRHESSPGTGHVISREVMEKEVMLMKQANINHVRNSHYPDDPYWYYLCDKYGIYLEDEANLESHQYYYGKESLSHPVEWRKAHVARVLEMVRSNINNPSIVIWSLGNEGGPGKNYAAAYDSLKTVDLSRPVQYERNNDIVDMGSNQYPSIAWTRGAVKGTYDIKYPFHISEYAHSMGNACGNLDDYWEAIESTNFFCGGAIWDWVDQSMYHYDAQTGKRYFAYGGDFGDTPNDGQFVMNGLVFGDLTPKPQYFEVKKVYQNIDVKPIDVSKGTFEVFNKYYFRNLNEYRAKWVLYENGKEIRQGDLGKLNIEPRKRMTVSVPFNKETLRDDAEYFVNVQFVLDENKPWAPKEYVQAEEQILVKEATALPAVNKLAQNGKKLRVSDSAPKQKSVKGENFEVKFDMNTGSIYSLVYGDETIIEAGNGPKLDAFRAFVNNDNWFYQQWFEIGLHNLKHQATSSKVTRKPNGEVVVAFSIESQAPNAAKILGGTSSGKNSIEELTDQPFGKNDFKFITNQTWTVYPDGSVELQAAIASEFPNKVLPRLGYVMKVPQQYADFAYYGRGPIENYADRKSGQFVRVYESTVADQFTAFPKPQEVGNHEDVRWCALTNTQGKGAAFVATDRLSVSALQYSALDMTLAGHPHQLPEAGDTYLRLDMGVTGLGGNSCGQGGPLVEDRVMAGYNNLGFIIRPVATKNELEAVANVKGAGERPAPVMLSQEGKNRLKVISASSQEVGDGNASHLTDGDRGTIWHTMYSVTVAKYPHWVDLDAGEEKTVKGFTYLPRQEGGNGDIRDYAIYVSQDGKNWGEAIHQAAFENNKKEKRVMFTQPVKARYIRFTALNAQNGDDFASGAELNIVTD